MTYSRRRFTNEFRINAVKLVLEEGRSMAEVAQDLNMSDKTLYSWVVKYKAGNLNATASNVSERDQEMAELRAALRKSQAEVKLLKKFTAYLAKQELT